MPDTQPAQAGVTLIELLIAVAIGAIVLSALNSVVSLGLQAQAAGRQRNELLFQARFALERMITTARTVSPKPLIPPPDDTTDNWFAPTGCVGAACVMFCRNASSQKLIETTTTDTTCIGTTVIATNVSKFSAKVPSGAGPFDKPVATLSLEIGVAPETVTLSTSVRLGGGTL
jgi:prepilin-type N-terminal cleavage/methylation domain-containing protein